MVPPALVARDVDVAAERRSGERVRLVADLNLGVAPREVRGIVGETGAGKTLSMKALLGLLPSGVRATGTLTLGNAPALDLATPSALAARRGRDIGVVLQNPLGSFDPLIRVKHQLIEGVLRHKLMQPTEARARAVALLTAMGFSDASTVLDLYPHQLSGGMSQRLAIAMALMSQPSVLIADEPTSALDAHLRVEALQLLGRAASDQGAAVLLVSHDLGLVSHFSHTITVMYAGRVVEEGPTSEVLSNPQHPYTVALLRCSPALDGEPRVPLPVIAGAPPLAGERPCGCPFVPRCPHAFSRCHDERPVLLATGQGSAACHLVRDPGDT